MAAVASIFFLAALAVTVGRALARASQRRDTGGGILAIMALTAPTIITDDLNGLRLAIYFSIAVGTAGVLLMVGAGDI